MRVATVGAIAQFPSFVDIRPEIRTVSLSNRKKKEKKKEKPAFKMEKKEKRNLNLTLRRKS